MRRLTDWLDLSDNAHAAAEAIGNAGPHISPTERELIGYCLDDDGGTGKAYHSSSTLRLYAKGLVEIADWLDERAALAQQEKAGTDG